MKPHQIRREIELAIARLNDVSVLVGADHRNRDTIDARLKQIHESLIRIGESTI